MLKQLLLLVSVIGVNSVIQAAQILNKVGQAVRSQAPTLRRGISSVRSSLSPLAQEVEHAAKNKATEAFHSSYTKEAEQRIKDISEMAHLDDRTKTLLMQRALRSQEAGMKINLFSKNIKTSANLSPEGQKVLETALIKTKIAPERIKVTTEETFAKNKSLKSQLKNLEQELRVLEKKIGATTNNYWEKTKTFVKKGSASVITHLLSGHLNVF